MDALHLTAVHPDFAVYELDPRGRVCGWGASAMRLSGYAADEMLGRPVSLITEGAVDVGATAIEETTREGRVEVSGWFVRRDGTRFWANEVTTALRDPEGRLTGFARIVRDVTRWKAAEDERDRVFTMSADLIGVAGFDGLFKRVNPSFARVLGHPEAEILGRPFIGFVHPDDVEATHAQSRALAAGRATSAFRNRYRCADGNYRWLEWNVTPLPADGLLFAVARDVTAQEAVERKLQEYARELERSNAELQQFAYVASHDLQEPLRAVAGCVQMLGERNAGKLDERSAELMGHAVDGAKRMRSLINDLLAFSRAGSKGVNRACVDARLAVDKALGQLGVALAESGAVVTVADPLPRAWADPVQLVQLFQNLIGNAVKFRAAGPPEVRVSAELGRGEVVFSVRDNGIGIAPEYHERVFGVFQRLHSRRDFAGTGIGLAICKKVVERHGGRIWVESREGAGADFRFALPAGPTL